MQQGDQNVSTEAQRQALEAMSAELVCKLNIMIQEQERRAREFAALHHSTLPTPAVPILTQQQPPAPTPEPQKQTPVYAPISPPPPATRKPQMTAPEWDPPIAHSKPRSFGKKEQSQPEDSNIGMGIVIFALVGIIMLIRSCT